MIEMVPRDFVIERYLMTPLCLGVAETEKKITLKATLDQVRKRAKKLKKELMSIP